MSAPSAILGPGRIESVVAYGDNPAQRLLDLLTAAKQHAASTPRKGWAFVFEVPEEDLGEILRRGAMTVDLAVQTREQVESHTDDDPGLILQNFGGVEATVRQFQNLGGLPQMANFLQHYTDLADYSLRHAASLLHRRQHEPVLSDPAQDDLTEKTRNLIDAIGNAEDLDPEVKLWAIGLLQQIEGALLRLRVTGTAGLDQAADRLVGGLVRRPSRLAGLMSNPVWTGVMGLITALNLAVGTATEWKALTSDERERIVVQVTQVPDHVDRPVLEGGR